MFSLRPAQPIFPVLVIAAVLVAGCSGGNGDSTATPAPSASSAPQVATSADAVASASPSLSETAWLAGIESLAKKMIDVMGDNVVVTSKRLREEAGKLGECSAELSRLGPATDRFQPVLLLAKQGCAKYEEAAKCFAAAAKTDIAKAGSCLAAVNQASELFTTAQITAESLKDSVN